MKLRKNVRIPHRSAKSTPSTSSSTVTPAPVTRLTMAQPELEHNTLTDGGKPCHLRVIPARACAQPVHHSRTLSEQEEHDNQDQEKVAQEPRDAGEDRAEGLGQ